ncbi:ArsA family ATPase [Halalkalicoccus sp. GCM10025322]|uniref:ArsA family ATPase n=1 Tax=Halalkalicoccus TaxID=332246 RepID=UPI002F9631F0
MTQFVLYGGKGGVGKTTCAAATALSLAESGHETLVLSTDPAHSLSDSFEADLDGEPRELRTRLWAVEIDPDDRAEQYRELASSLAADLRSAGIRLDDEDVEEVFGAGVPAGGDEVAALDAFVEFADSDRWEYVVLDTAPTGHTLRLLDLPDVMSATLEKTLSVRGQVQRLADSAKRVTMGPAYYFGGNRRSEGGEGFEELKARMERARELLTDPERTEFRVVLVPESMAISESERLVERLREAGLPVRTLVVNKVLEEIDEGCERCRIRQDLHEQRLAEIGERFSGLDVQTLPDRVGEVHGLESLEAVAERLSA